MECTYRYYGTQRYYDVHGLLTSALECQEVECHCGAYSLSPQSILTGAKECVLVTSGWSVIKGCTHHCHVGVY